MQSLHTVHSPNGGFDKIPNEILDKILGYLALSRPALEELDDATGSADINNHSPAHLRNLSLASTRLAVAVRPFLYGNVAVRDGKALARLFHVLKDNEPLAYLIKSFHLGMNLLQQRWYQIDSKLALMFAKSVRRRRQRASKYFGHVNKVPQPCLYDTEDNEDQDDPLEGNSWHKDYLGEAFLFGILYLARGLEQVSLQKPCEMKFHYFEVAMTNERAHGMLPRLAKVMVVSASSRGICVARILQGFLVLPSLRTIETLRGGWEMCTERLTHTSYPNIESVRALETWGSLGQKLLVSCLFPRLLSFEFEDPPPPKLADPTATSNSGWGSDWDSDSEEETDYDFIEKILAIETSSKTLTKTIRTSCDKWDPFGYSRSRWLPT